MYRSRHILCREEEWRCSALVCEKASARIHATRAVCVFFLLTQCRRPLVGNRDHGHVCVVDYGLGCSLASPLRWRRACESADIKVLWVHARSLIHVQVVGGSEHH